jgi:hypothetical protein
MMGLNKFETPFVGNWTAVLEHYTVIHDESPQGAVINHTLGGTTCYTSVGWE